jgi:hypothetical protein
MKFSCFPEAVKNFGSGSLLPVMKMWMFVAATVVHHGGSYTALWTWLGVDTAQRLQYSGSSASNSSSSISVNLGSVTSNNMPMLPIMPMPANVPLNVALVVAGVSGVVVSPLLMAWWLRTLKRQADALTADTIITV